MDEKTDKEIGQKDIEEDLFSKNSERILYALKILKSQIAKTPYRIKIFTWEIFSECRQITDEMQLDFFDIILSLSLQLKLKRD